ncbi:precorrin-2 dehydrogenase/sirohydrochlorin ferrochelatase family protein [Halalkalibacterium ligniniphilum]|uniref:precorrin-2 dehydrogenase/sirohydrochlorin ferrochelatase family protein n=1 Tax=Halalkalibacterium ligniniphilum TaxID=1134413 RepID=UPI00034816B0|nr:bifunctional precorrin-2 dehydrogenase/sirohydrochlorin ferrochelatase [Halalkalibacterium ligniniphilum]
MNQLPVMLNLAGRPVVCVGGGAVAARRIPRLLEAGASVTVISPSIHATIAQLKRDGKIDWHQKSFESDDVTGAFLLLAATNQREVNQQVLAAKKPEQLIYLADSPEQSDVMFPSSIQKGPLTIAISTNGASPIYARQLRQEIEAILPEHVEETLDFLGEARQRIKETIHEETKRRQLLTEISHPSFLAQPDRWQQLERIIKSN